MCKRKHWIRLTAAFCLAVVFALTACRTPMITSGQSHNVPLQSDTPRPAQEEAPQVQMTATIGDREIPFGQTATVASIQLAAGHTEKLKVQFSADATAVSMTAVEKFGSEYTLYAPNYGTASTAREYVFSLPQADGTYQVQLQASLAKDGQNSNFQNSFTLVVGTGQAPLQDAILPDFVGNPEAIITISYEDNPLEFDGEALRPYLLAMRLAPATENAQTHTQYVKRRFLVTVEHEEKQVVLDFTPWAVQVNDESCLPQNAIAIECMLQQDALAMGYLSYPYQLLGQMLPFTVDQVQKAVHTVIQLDGRAQSEEVPVSQLQEQVFSQAVSVWPEDTQPGPRGNISQTDEWVLTLLDGREYRCVFAVWNSYLLAPDGTKTLFIHGDNLAKNAQ